MFVTVIGSTVGIGTPSNNTVTTAILQNGSVTTPKITDANVTTAKIADSAVTSAKIQDGTIVNADINGSAAIAGSKINPLLDKMQYTGWQTYNENVNPYITLTDTNSDSDFSIQSVW